MDSAESWQGENFGFALKALAQGIESDRPALLHAGRSVSWGELDRITDAIAAGLLARGLRKGDVAGQMLRNAPEYILAYFGCAKAGISPVNVNYHYKERELADIASRFGMKALFCNESEADLAACAMSDDALAPFIAEPGNERWEKLCAHEVPAHFTVCDDLDTMFLMATGGTTGMPKAVMWPYREAWPTLGITAWSPNPLVAPELAETLEQHVAKATEQGPGHPDSQAPLMLLCPLMHGTGQYSAITHILRGGTLVTMPAQSFDADAAIDTIREREVRVLVVVGDAHALPLVTALEARPDTAEAIASLRMIGSSGALFSETVKQRLLAINPGMLINDVLGSSESGGTALRITTKDGTLGGGDFVAVPDRGITLFDEDLNEIAPGSDAIGIVARTGPLPLGYLGEDEKNAATFPIVRGKRYLITGDRARWGADGTLDFIGRDNMCINTGGEKVFPEEVEEVLQAHDGVKDVRVVSLPDERFGRKVVAVVQPANGAEGLADALDAHARAGLAGYKIPRAYIFTQASLRLNNGKPDYKGAQAIADESEAATS